jgi:hypothetical protein
MTTTFSGTSNLQFFSLRFHAHQIRSLASKTHGLNARFLWVQVPNDPRYLAAHEFLSEAQRTWYFVHLFKRAFRTSCSLQIAHVRIMRKTTEVS